MDYDIIIVGGGLVGASFACALKGLPLKVLLLDARDNSSDEADSFDDRSIALSSGSCQAFEEMAMWSSMRQRAEAIQHIHVSDEGHGGMVRLHADAFGHSAFGHVVESKRIGEALYRELNTLPNVERLAPASVLACKAGSGFTQLEVRVAAEPEHLRSLKASMVVAADGAHSTMARLLNVGAQRHDYNQFALITNVSTQKAHNNWAFERFTASGPLAFLPLTDERMSVVYTLDPEGLASCMAEDEARFMSRLQGVFGYRLGKITRVGRRSSFPLVRIKTRREFVHRTVFIGNASHNLHPVAGQGFNLGMRDVIALRNRVKQAIESGQELGSHGFMAAYAEKREADHRLMMTATHQLVNLYSSKALTKVAARNGIASVFNFCPTMQKPLITAAMGEVVL